MEATESAGIITSARLPLKARQPALGDGFIYGLVVFFAPFYMTAIGMAVHAMFEPRPWATVAAWSAAVALLVLIAVLSFRQVRKRRATLQRAPALLDADAIQGVPVVGRSSATETFRFAQVTRLERIPGKLLLVELGERTLTLRDADFVDADALDAMAHAIQSAMSARPDGAALQDEHESRHELGTEIRQRRTYGTYTLLTLIALAFCGQLAVGDLEKATTLVRLGGNAPALVRDGQWWRVVTAGLLHGNFLHFYMNAVALYSVGVLVEKLIGRARFLIVVLVSSVVGHSISAWAASSLVSVGASAGIFGLLGALLVVQTGHRRAMPLALAIAPRRWLGIIGINAVISLLPGVDSWAHLGGIVCGAVLALGFSPTLDVRKPRAGAVLVAISSTLVVLCAGAVSYALWRGEGNDDLAIAVSMKDDAPWVRHELPGFSLEMPPGRVEAPVSDYGAGRVQVTSLVKGRIVMMTTEWRPSGGEQSDASTLTAAANAAAASLKATGAPRIFEISGPSSQTILATEIVTEQVTMDFALLPCGQRFIQVMVGDKESPARWLSRAASSFKCRPTPDQEAALTQAPGFPLVVELPGWYETSQSANQVVLTDGQSLLMTFVVPRSLERSFLKSYVLSVLNQQGAQLAAGDSVADRDTFTGTVNGQHVVGWYRQFSCGPQRSVILMAVTGDQRIANRLVDMTDAARCLKAGEAPKEWPAEPRHPH